jgi:arylsulfatase
LEHATCYSPDNYWCALTDGKIKYIWFMHSGEEQLFDLTTDPGEKKDLAKTDRYRKQLSEMRKEMVQHLQERGDSFVKNGQLVKRDKTLLYSPNYPKEASK